jgi:CBS domain-containing protein
MSVETAMTKDVVTVRSTEKVKDAWLSLMRRGITGAPVVDDSGALVGVLSMTDINRAIVERVDKVKALREATMQFPDKVAEEKEEMREMAVVMRAITECTVAAILPKDQKVFSLGPFDSLERGIKIMAEHAVNRLPVVKDGRVIGIVTRQDIILLVAGKSRMG